MRIPSLAILMVVATTAHVVAQSGSGWLDRAMTGWNVPSKGVPLAQPGTEPQSALERRCGSSTLAASMTADILRKAGWVPFLHFDQAISRNDIEVIGGMSAASPGCEPTLFNLFVFVAGRYAGTVSPGTMTPNRDGVVGAARIAGEDSLIAEFARYAATDTECCPSSRVRVNFRIDRAGTPPMLVPTDARRVR